MSAEDDSEALDDRERSRTSRRDRKRDPRMVVDNAGVKRLLAALAWRRRARSAPAGGSGAGDGGPAGRKPTS